MILALLLTIQAAPAPAAEAGSASDEVVVTAPRLQPLKRLRMVTRREPTGALTCVFKRSGGYPTMDALVCRATLDCVPKVKTAADMHACMAPTLDALVAPGARWQAEAPHPGS